ncbi:MAG: hypothetical protein JSW00_03810 [Thermoplasmata archaeon]|nr:MAG: hypothetical protein JSW00_03810 [Thermoplasmata archaeon]
MMPEEERVTQGDVQHTPEGKIKAYVEEYIDSYMNHVEEMNIDEADFPLFYTYYPFQVTGYILPDRSTCILYKGLASATQIDVKNADFDVVDEEIAKRKFDHICCYPPSHSFTKSEAKKRAKADVKRDVKSVQQVRSLDAERSAKEHTIKTLRMLAVVAPWTARRRTEKPGQKEPAKITSSSLKIKEGEDFTTYSDRLNDLETSVFEKETPSKPPEIPPPAPSDTPPPPPPVKVEAPPQTDVTASQAGPQPTNISIEIKQPEVAKTEGFDEKKDLELLRMKKTLYIQATDIENMRRRELELANKVQNIEQMRQTVFRMNRKVYDTDTKVTKLEASNRELVNKIDEMRLEQQEENKKMRRFITEKAKKARNQALIVAVIAIAISLFSLPFLLMLVVKYWSEIKSMIGL